MSGEQTQEEKKTASVLKSYPRDSSEGNMILVRDGGYERHAVRYDLEPPQDSSLLGSAKKWFSDALGLREDKETQPVRFKTGKNIKTGELLNVELDGHPGDYIHPRTGVAVVGNEVSVEYENKTSGDIDERIICSPALAKAIKDAVPEALKGAQYSERDHTSPITAAEAEKAAHAYNVITDAARSGFPKEKVQEAAKAFNELYQTAKNDPANKASGTNVNTNHSITKPSIGR